MLVHPLDEAGFEVAFQDLGGRYRVRFGGWHETLGTVDAALDRFALGLSTVGRLKVWRRGGTDYRWQLETLEDGTWVAAGVVGLLLFPFWRRLEVRYLQNRFFQAA